VSCSFCILQPTRPPAQAEFCDLPVGAIILLSVSFLFHSTLTQAAEPVTPSPSPHPPHLTHPCNLPEVLSTTHRKSPSAHRLLCSRFLSRCALSRSGLGTWDLEEFIITSRSRFPQSGFSPTFCLSRSSPGPGHQQSISPSASHRHRSSIDSCLHPAPAALPAR
jgi:hypothetical protein